MLQLAAGMSDDGISSLVMSYSFSVVSLIYPVAMGNPLPNATASTES